ncbi:intraflagellar transport-associated protein-like [Pristis pectinata]|uniref:intraflagellar transport-associated protein-like n=1 Tax=Pristis pectinata TaxID=685728 RepID=UPI00223CF71E|nr:intraflagellar transport-associated protein-like [Pristis pectinata]
MVLDTNNVTWTQNDTSSFLLFHTFASGTKPDGVFFLADPFLTKGRTTIPDGTCSFCSVASVGRAGENRLHLPAGTAPRFGVARATGQERDAVIIGRNNAQDVLLFMILTAMEKEGITCDALEKFCRSHEQTYEEFLESFIHLRREDMKKQNAAPPDIAEISEDAGKYLDMKDVLTHSLEKGGQSLKDDKEVENYIDIEDLDSGKGSEQQSGTGGEVLPGKIEEEIPANYSHCEYKYTTLDFKVYPCVEEFNNKAHDQVFTDEVQPFTLDEEFDYNCVYFKPKYTEAELKTLSALSQQRRESGEYNAAKLNDSVL